MNQRSRRYYRRGPFTQFRRFPVEAFDDEELNSSHIDVLIAMTFFNDYRDGVFMQYINVRPRDIAVFTSYGEKSVRRTVVDLAERGYLEVKRDGLTIVQVEWAKPYIDALRGFAPFIRLPMAVIHDTSLTTKQRHAYLAVLRHEYWSREYTNRRGADPFFLSVSMLAKKMGAKRHIASRTLKELSDLYLVDFHDTMPDFRGMRAMVIVPLNLRYAVIKSAHGERTFNTKFCPIPEDTPREDDPPYAYSKAKVRDRCRQDWVDDNKPSFVDSPYSSGPDTDFIASFWTEGWYEEQDQIEEEKEERETRHLRAIEGGAAS